MDLVIRATVVFFFIFLITRIVGRRELSSLEPFDVILLVVLGDLVQQGITQSDQSVTGTLTVISTVSLLSVAVGWVSFKSRRLRPVLEGEPLVLVNNGRVLERNLRREHLTRSDIEEEARQQQIGSATCAGRSSRTMARSASSRSPDQIHAPLRRDRVLLNRAAGTDRAGAPGPARSDVARPCRR